MTLEEKLDRLVQLILRARTFFDLWWVYESETTRPIYISAIQKYSEFFRFDSDAQIAAYTIYLCQIFEDNPKTLNINKVLKQTKDRGLSNKKIGLAEKAIKDGLPIYEKLRFIRNNIFAHRSGKLSYKKVFEKGKITPNEIKSLTELGLKAINSLRTALGQDEFEFSTLPEKHLKKLLEDISHKDNISTYRDEETPVNIEKLRNSFKPTKIKLLLVGESPPANGRFFYDKSLITSYTASAFTEAYGKEYSDAESFLLFFKDKGCYLDDFSYAPIYKDS